MGPCCATESKLRRFSKELCLKQQRPASITRPWSPVYLKCRRSNGGRRKNEHGQSLCDSECPIQLQQPCPERPRPFEGRRPRTTSARTPAEGGFYIPGERGGPSSLGGGGCSWTRRVWRHREAAAKTFAFPSQDQTRVSRSEFKMSSGI